MGRVGAFFDVDKTILAENSATLYLRALYERDEVDLRTVPTIRELLEHAEELAREEARRTAQRMPSFPETEQAAERMAQAIVAKLLHRPLQRLRAEAEEGRAPYYADAVREIFGLSKEDE